MSDRFIRDPLSGSFIDPDSIRTGPRQFIKFDLPEPDKIERDVKAWIHRQAMDAEEARLREIISQHPSGPQFLEAMERGDEVSPEAVTEMQAYVQFVNRLTGHLP